MSPTALYFAASFLLAWASLGTGPALGRYRPVPLLLWLLLAYNAVPFIASQLWPTTVQAMLGDTADFYTATVAGQVARQLCWCVLAAFGGQLLASVMHERQPRHVGLVDVAGPPPAVDTTYVAGLFLLLAVAAGGAAWTVRGALFAGYDALYQESTTEFLRRGTFSSVFLLLFVTYVVYWHVGSDWRLRRARRRAEYGLTSAVVIGFGLLLGSLGGRLYLASALLALACVRLALGSPIPAPGPGPGALGRPRRWRGVLVAVGALGAAGVVGIWRTQGTLDLAALAVNLLGEPLMISISLASLYCSNTLPAFAAPTSLLGDWVGLLPSSLYPEKAERLRALFGLYRMEAPMGGLSGLASMVGDFGWLGTILLFGAVGFGLTLATAARGHDDRVGARRLVFVIATSLPMLSLMRDPTVTSVYKNLLQNSLFWPWLLSMLVGVRTALPGRRPGRSTRLRAW